MYRVFAATWRTDSSAPSAKRQYSGKPIVEAGKRFDRAYKLDQSALRIVQSYGSWTSRNGNKDDAVKIFKEFDKTLPHHPLIDQALAQLDHGDKVPQIVASGLGEGQGLVTRVAQSVRTLEPGQHLLAVEVLFTVEIDGQIIDGEGGLCALLGKEIAALRF